MTIIMQKKPRKQRLKLEIFLLVCIVIFSGVICVDNAIYAKAIHESKTETNQQSLSSQSNEGERLVLGASDNHWATYYYNMQNGHYISLPIFSEPKDSEIVDMSDSKYLDVTRSQNIHSKFKVDYFNDIQIDECKDMLIDIEIYESVDYTNQLMRRSEKEECDRNEFYLYNDPFIGQNCTGTEDMYSNFINDYFGDVLCRLTIYTCDVLTGKEYITIINGSNESKKNIISNEQMDQFLNLCKKIENKYTSGFTSLVNNYYKCLQSAPVMERLTKVGVDSQSGSTDYIQEGEIVNILCTTIRENHEIWGEIQEGKWVCLRGDENIYFKKVNP